jgi:membrane protease YdiL (CAAX protease family)
MPEIPDKPEPPIVIRVEDPVPLVRPIGPPRPGLFEACALTFGYWLVLIGGMLAVVFVAAFLFALLGDKKAMEINPDNGESELSRIPAPLRTAIAWSFPAGYLAGLIFTLIVLRVVVGRTWVHDIGLARVPLYHLAIALVALPGFVVMSDAIAQLVQPIDGLIERTTGLGNIGDTSETLRVLFQDSHWMFVIFAIGVGPGVVEELWCRGFLGRGLIGRYGWCAGIVLSSLFFGLLHLWPISYVIVTAVMGAGLHFAYVISRSLWVPISIHMANNSVAGLASMKAIPSDQMEAAMATHPTPIIVAAVCVLLFCGLALWHSRWTWAGERRGILIPPEGLDLELRAARPDLIYTIAALGFCAALLGLLFA